jgi:hypothetical protein
MERFSAHFLQVKYSMQKYLRFNAVTKLVTKQGIRVHKDTRVYNHDAFCHTGKNRGLVGGGWGVEEMRAPAENNILVQASKTLPTISSFYGANQSLNAALQIFSVWVKKGGMGGGGG